MKIENLKKKDYLSANDLIEIIPNLTYLNALNYIKKGQQEMKNRGFIVPTTKPKVALTKILRELFGF